MSLHADTLLDRVYLKGQITKWRILAVLALVIAVIVAVERFSDFAPIETDYIARFNVEGIIVDDVKRDELLEKVKNNDAIKALLVVVDSPGGTAVGGEQLFKSLRSVSEKKPVVCLMRSMATSAGYMAAVGADRIYAMEGTITGSIGVIVQMAEVTTLAEKLGITPITVKSGPLKGSPSMFEKFTPDQREATQSVVDNFFGTFIRMVETRRKLPHEEVVKLADGRIYSGNQALELKLVDAIGGEKEAVAWLAKAKKIDETLKIKEVKVKKDEKGLSRLLDGLAGSVGLKDIAVRLDGLVSIWQPNGL